MRPSPSEATERAYTQRFTVRFQLCRDVTLRFTPLTIMRTYLSGIILFLLACVSCTEKELPIPTTQDLSGTIWESEFKVDTEDGKVPAKLTFYFNSEDEVRVYLVGPRFTRNNMRGEYSLNKNILKHTVWVLSPDGIITEEVKSTWIIRKRTEKTMVWDPTPQGVDFRDYIYLRGAVIKEPITLYKKS